MDTPEEKKKNHPFKAKILTIMGKENPETDEVEENEFMDKAHEHISGLEEQNGKMLEANQKFFDHLMSDPDFQACYNDLMQGASFREAIARNIDISTLTPQEGDPDLEGWKKSSEERIAKMKEKEDYIARISKNKEMVSPVMEEFQKKEGLSDEEMTQFVDDADAFFNKIIDFEVDLPTLDKVYKMINHEKIVAKETEAAKVAGANEAIVAKKEKVSKGDGLPNVSVTATEIAAKPVDEAQAYKDYITKKNRA
jgi:hypothetical protein